MSPLNFKRSSLQTWAWIQGKGPGMLEKRTFSWSVVRQPRKCLLKPVHHTEGEDAIISTNGDNEALLDSFSLKAFQVLHLNSDGGSCGKTQKRQLESVVKILRTFLVHTWSIVAWVGVLVKNVSVWGKLRKRPVGRGENCPETPFDHLTGVLLKHAGGLKLAKYD